LPKSIARHGECPERDGLRELEEQASLLFPNDNRIREAASVLRSSTPIVMRVSRPVEASDHDYEQLKQKNLLMLCSRAISLPVGRGMLTLGNNHNPPVTELLPIPHLCLKGRLPPTNVTVNLDMSECPPELMIWPNFHNGVATGLRLPSRDGDGSKFRVTRSWIRFNKPPLLQEDEELQATQMAKQDTHAGLLLALGLRGQLDCLEMTDVYEYLIKGAITTTVGLLLGLAANKRGTCDIQASKMMSLHIPSLIPQHFSAIDVASAVQTAAVASLGLLYQGSGHRMMTEFLLNEIGRRPDSDVSTVDREAYSLSCGIARKFTRKDSTLHSPFVCRQSAQ
jgi:anaphase-promoting complex subunit 1